MRAAFGRPLFLLLLTMVALGARAQSNQAFPQKVYYASDYGTWQVKGTTPNTYQFQPSSLCVFPQPSTGTFNAFNQNAPVYLQDSVVANSELLTPAFVLINETLCEVALTPAHNHYSFNLMSGTAGLQEVLNTISGLIPYPAQVILDRNWYTALTAIPGQTASAVIGSVKGNTAAILADVTQAPTQYYKWNGSAYAAVGPAGGSIPANGGLLQTSGTIGVASASNVLPNGATATTQPPTDTSLKVANSAALQAAEHSLFVANAKQYGAQGNGASHQACTFLGLGSLGALQAYNGGQYSFATACTNQMDWLATQYAVNLLTSTGGSVKLSGGPYIWDQPVILPNEQDSYSGSLKAIYLVGDGEGGTLIEPAVADFGAATGMVSCGPPTANWSDNSGAGSGRYGSIGACYGGILDITFYNPFSDPTAGAGSFVNVTSTSYARGIINVPAPQNANTGNPVQMDGVLLGGRMYLHRVGSWGFRMGFNMVGDHMTWDQLDAEKDFCGVYWAPASIYLVGDIIMTGHNFISGNSFAGTCVDKDASIIGFYHTGEIYTGYQPYAWIKFPGESDNYGEAFGGGYTPFFANANLDIIQSEAIGNAVMWDDNLTSSGGGVQAGQSSIGGLAINGIYTIFGSGSGQKITTGGRGPYAYFGSGSFNGFKLGNIYAGANNFYPTSGQLAGIIANFTAFNDGGIDISGDLNDVLAQYSAIEFVGLATSGGTACQNVALHVPGQWDGGEVAIYPANTEPVPGDLLTAYNYQADTISAGTAPVTGVAMQTLTTNTAGGQCVAYADHGIVTVLNTGTPTTGALVVASTGSAGKAVQASGTAGYAVGTVRNGAATSSPVKLNVNAGKSTN